MSTKYKSTRNQHTLLHSANHDDVSYIQNKQDSKSITSQEPDQNQKYRNSKAANVVEEKVILVMNVLNLVIVRAANATSYAIMEILQIKKRSHVHVLCK
jgi:hypothetical protein